MPYSETGVLNVKKMLISSKLFYKFNAIPLKLLSGFLIVWQTASKAVGDQRTKDIHTRVGEWGMGTWHLKWRSVLIKHSMQDNLV